MTAKTEVKREFIHAAYTRNSGEFGKDLLTIKEHIHHPDGTITPNVRLVYDYERTFYITKKPFRDHKQKKEYELMEKLDVYHCTQAAMTYRAKRLLDMWGARTLTDIGESPYLYGTDITTPVLMAHDYSVKWPGLFTPATVAILDYETNVLDPRPGMMGKIVNIGSYAFKDKVTVVIHKDFLDKNNIPIHTRPDEVEKEIRRLTRIHLEAFILDQFTFEFIFVDKPSDVVKTCVNLAHADMPDYVGCWSISADMGFMLDTLADEGIEPEKVFCDKRVPPDYRSFRYIVDVERKEKADGKGMAKHWADLWHKVECPASFKWVDQMAFYKHQRMRDQQRSSYKLDAVLNDHGLGGKVKIPEVEGLDGLDFHIKMQRDFPLEYVVYAIADSAKPLLLDRQTRDLSYGFRGGHGLSEPSRMKSLPKQRVDDFHFVLLEEGKVIGSTSANMRTELDQHTPSPRDWIVALQPELEYELGVNLINEYPCLETNIITHSYDSDIRSCYPMGEATTNVGKTTNRLEVCRLMNQTTDAITRAAGINLTALHTNSIEIVTTTLGWPEPDDLLAEFLQEVE